MLLTVLCFIIILQHKDESINRRGKGSDFGNPGQLVGYVSGK